MVTERLAMEGALEEGSDPDVARVRTGAAFKFRPDLAIENAPLGRLLYAGRMMAFYERLLGGEVRHFDYTWLRAVSPGKGTAPHGDSVFMNRGTTSLYTAWVPLGAIDYRLGGLIVLEQSHRLDEIKNSYGQRDVDTYCADDAGTEIPNGELKAWTGTLSDDPFALREQLGLRWLSAEFQLGDLLTFTMYTIHASLDNQTDRIRFSTDSRYQLASEPVDPRWIGEHPVGHGPEAKIGMIC